MTADQKVISIDGEQSFEKSLKQLMKPSKQSQKVAAEEMKSLMGGMGLPGM